MKWIVFTWTCSESCDDLELYKRMVSYVMAYSFTEPPKDDDSDDFGEDEEEEKSTIYMVPMADMLNHIANNNAHLSFKPDCLEMIATKDIKKVYIVYILSECTLPLVFLLHVLDSMWHLMLHYVHNLLIL